MPTLSAWSPVRVATRVRFGPFADDGPGDNISLSFEAYNRNKRSVVLNLSDEGERMQFLELVKGADFLIDSGPGGILDDAQMTHQALLKANPQLVHVRVSAFGSDGPRADLPAADLTIAALGGPVFLQGEADRAPLRISVPQAWRHAGAEAAIAALVGHARVRTTGEGVFVDVSAQTTMTWTMLQAMTAHAIQGFDMSREGSEMKAFQYQIPVVRKTRDGYVVALTLGKDLQKLAPWMVEEGAIDEAWLARENWSTFDTRLLSNAGDDQFTITPDEMNDTLDTFFASQSSEVLFRRGLELDVTIALMNSVEDLVNFEHLREREYFARTSVAGVGEIMQPGPFARLTSTPITLRRPAPELGEHTEEILSELHKSPRRVKPFDIPKSASELPLAGVKVADFSWVGVGPISVKCLADHGAEVIRVESSTRMDGLRNGPPFKDDKPGVNRSHFYGEFNTSKRSLSLDLGHERAAEVTRRLLEWADIVVESFSPGTIDRLGIGYEAVRAINPGIIMVSTSLMGQTGPLRKIAGYGYHAAGFAGFLGLTGWPDRAPCGPFNAYTDTIAPRFLTASVLAALDHRRRTGEGQYIDVSQLEASLHFLAPEILASQVSGARFERAGNRLPDAAPQGVYPCAGEDNWVAIAVENNSQWLALCEVLDNPDWNTGKDLSRVAGRLAAHDLIDEKLAIWTRLRTSEEVMQTLCAAGVPAGTVQRSSELLRDPQYVHRKFHREMMHAEMGQIPYSGHQFLISGYDNGPLAPAPLLGGDNNDILQKVLGFSSDEIEALVDSRAIK